MERTLKELGKRWNRCHGTNLPEKYYKQMEVIYIFPMIFKAKPVFNSI